MEKLEMNKKENKLGLIVLILSIFICVATVGYALWSRTEYGKKENVLKTGTLVLNLNKESNQISVKNAIPLSDSEGMKQVGYTFRLENTGTTAANYRLSIVDDNEYYLNDGCSNNKLDWIHLRYAFEEGNTTPIIKDLVEQSGILKEGTIDTNQSISFSLKLWLKGSNTTQADMGKHFHGKIKVEAIQSDQELK